MTDRSRDPEPRPRDPSTSNPELEEREVRAADPGLSPDTNRRVTEEVRDVIGSDRVRVPADRPHPSRGERPPTVPYVSALIEHRLFIGQGAAAVIVIAAIIGLTVNDWWILGIALAALLAALLAVVALTFSMTTVRERPSPSTAAALEEEGVYDPETHFSQVVSEFTEDEGARGANERTTPVEDAPTTAAAEQESATTPTGGPSHAVGPGRRSRSRSGTRRRARQKR